MSLEKFREFSVDQSPLLIANCFQEVIIEERKYLIIIFEYYKPKDVPKGINVLQEQEPGDLECLKDADKFRNICKKLARETKFVRRNTIFKAEYLQGEISKIKKVKRLSTIASIGKAINDLTGSTFLRFTFCINRGCIPVDE